MGKRGNGFGKIVVFATIAGAVAAGISYFTKYKSFHKELEEDFHDFEDDGNDDISMIDSTMNRNYVSLHADRDEFKVAASDMADAAKDAANAAKNMMKDAAGIVNHTAREAANAVAGTAREILENARERSENDRDADPMEDGGLDYEAGAVQNAKEREKKVQAAKAETIKNDPITTETNDEEAPDTTTIEEDRP